MVYDNIYELFVIFIENAGVITPPEFNRDFGNAPVRLVSTQDPLHNDT